MYIYIYLYSHDFWGLYPPQFCFLSRCWISGPVSWRNASMILRRPCRSTGQTRVPDVFFRWTTWWLIPLSKWVITPVINGISRVNPLVTGVITHLLNGMSHQVVVLVLATWQTYMCLYVSSIQVVRFYSSDEIPLV